MTCVEARNSIECLFIVTRATIWQEIAERQDHLFEKYKLCCATPYFMLE